MDERRSMISDLLRGKYEVSAVVTEAKLLSVEELENKFPVDEFKNIISKRAGAAVPGLEISFEATDRGPKVNVSSGNMVDKTGIMSGVFSEVTIEDFGGSVFADPEHGPTVSIPIHINWAHHSGGTNGGEWFTAYYMLNSGKWLFRNAKGSME